MDKAKAKKSWESAGLNEQGITAINTWIDDLAQNVENGKGRWDAYEKFAFCGTDIMGSVKMLKEAVEQTGK